MTHGKHKQVWRKVSGGAKSTTTTTTTATTAKRHKARKPRRTKPARKSVPRRVRGPSAPGRSRMSIGAGISTEIQPLQYHNITQRARIVLGSVTGSDVTNIWQYRTNFNMLDNVLCPTLYPLTLLYESYRIKRARMTYSGRYPPGTGAGYVYMGFSNDADSSLADDVIPDEAFLMSFCEGGTIFDCHSVDNSGKGLMPWYQTRGGEGSTEDVRLEVPFKMCVASIGIPAAYVGTVFCDVEVEFKNFIPQANGGVTGGMAVTTGYDTATDVPLDITTPIIGCHSASMSEPYITILASDASYVWAGIRPSIPGAFQFDFTAKVWTTTTGSKYGGLLLGTASPTAYSGLTDLSNYGCTIMCAPGLVPDDSAWVEVPVSTLAYHNNGNSFNTASAQIVITQEFIDSGKVIALIGRKAATTQFISMYHSTSITVNGICMSFHRINKFKPRAAYPYRPYGAGKSVPVEPSYLDSLARRLSALEMKENLDDLVSICSTTDTPPPLTGFKPVRR